MSLEDMLKAARKDPELVDAVVWTILTECPERRQEACRALRGVCVGSLDLGELVNFLCEAAPSVRLEGKERAYFLAGFAWALVVMGVRHVEQMWACVGNWGVSFENHPILEGRYFKSDNTGWFVVGAQDRAQFKVRRSRENWSSWTPSWTVLDIEDLGELRAALASGDLGDVYLKPELGQEFHAYLARWPLQLLATGLRFEHKGVRLSTLEAMMSSSWSATLCGLPLEFGSGRIPCSGWRLTDDSGEPLYPELSNLFLQLVCAVGLGREVEVTSRLVSEWGMAKLTRSLLEPHPTEEGERNLSGAILGFSFVLDEELQARCRDLIEEQLQSRASAEWFKEISMLMRWISPISNVLLLDDEMEELEKE